MAGIHWHLILYLGGGVVALMMGGGQVVGIVNPQACCVVQNPQKGQVAFPMGESAQEVLQCLVVL